MEPRTPLDHARDLLARGIAPIPVPYATKVPVLRRWQKLRLGADDLPRHFNGACGNVGALWGEPSGHIVDVDLDHPLAVRLADTILPPTGAAWGRAGKPRSHRLFRLTAPAKTRQWRLSATTTIVELRSTGTQSIAPGSVHPSGEVVHWYEAGEPASIDPTILIEALDELARAVRVQVEPPSNDTNDPIDPVVPIDPVNPVDPVRRLTPDEVLARTAVRGAGQHDAMTLRLARGLKLNAGISPMEARPWFDRWWAVAAPHCSNGDPDAALFKFQRAWETAAIPLDNPGVAARVLAMLDTLPPVPEESGFGPALGRLVRALAEMGRLTGDAPFALSARMVADACDVTVATAHEWLTGLVRCGLLECPDRGHPGVKGKGRARRLRWIGRSGM